MSQIISGSSPRTWGIHTNDTAEYVYTRFIPTNVGNTLASSEIFIHPPVHPHERGEYWSGFVASQGLLRFIPTNVGNTFTTHILGAKMTVHPHERGEYFPSDPVEGNLFGSSPRTWGILFRQPLTHRNPRFIPTNVGNTQRRETVSRVRAVHPHERGEYAASPIFPP